MKSARGVMHSESLQIIWFENVNKRLVNASHSFKNSTKSIAKKHFGLDVGQKLHYFTIQVRRRQSPGGPANVQKQYEHSGGLAKGSGREASDH